MGDMLVRELGIFAEESARFEEIAQGLGLSGKDAMRALVYAFNAHRGFPHADSFSDEAEPYDVLFDEDFADRLRAQIRNLDTEEWKDVRELRGWLEAEGMVG